MPVYFIIMKGEGGGKNVEIRKMLTIVSFILWQLVGNEETRSVATTEKIPHTQNSHSGFTGQYTIGSLICYDGMLRKRIM